MAGILQNAFLTVSNDIGNPSILSFSPFPSIMSNFNASIRSIVARNLQNENTFEFSDARLVMSYYAFIIPPSPSALIPETVISSVRDSRIVESDFSSFPITKVENIYDSSLEVLSVCLYNHDTANGTRKRYSYKSNGKHDALKLKIIDEGNVIWTLGFYVNATEDMDVNVGVAIEFEF